MKMELALNTGNEIIKIGDRVVVQEVDAKKPRNTTLDGIFTSVHPPHVICLNFSDRPLSTSVDKIKRLQKEQDERGTNG